ncbi:hypothetical protein [Vulcanisaeta sp. JCM 16159]|uniref:hypothetical protein n=1 Tax=Vulcanisaeta sp. JCM 16159 TaxID=1295371 RepID=UPI0006D2C609|nr:hypothetical protein [Vulcanisaeta sp. JCM 16159]
MEAQQEQQKKYKFNMTTTIPIHIDARIGDDSFEYVKVVIGDNNSITIELKEFNGQYILTFDSLFMTFRFTIKPEPLLTMAGMKYFSTADINDLLTFINTVLAIVLKALRSPAKGGA